jgi:hypothetical protein
VLPRRYNREDAVDQHVRREQENERQDRRRWHHERNDTNSDA